MRDGVDLRALEQRLTEALCLLGPVDRQLLQGEEILRLASDAPRHVPTSVSNLTGAVSNKADDLTEAARSKAHAKAHDVVDLADQKIDDVADHAQQIREQSEARLDPGTTTATSGTAFNGR